MTSPSTPDLKQGVFATSLPLDSLFQMNVDYSGGTDPIYVGYAAPGTADATEGWLIVKYTYDANDNVTKARFANDQAEFAMAWSSRATYTYS